MTKHEYIEMVKQMIADIEAKIRSITTHMEYADEDGWTRQKRNTTKRYKEILEAKRESLLQDIALA